MGRDNELDQRMLFRLVQAVCMQYSDFIVMLFDSGAKKCYIERDIKPGIQ